MNPQLPQNEIRKHMESLDADLLRSSVQNITIQKRHAIVQLKNGQTVE